MAAGTTAVAEGRPGIFVLARSATADGTGEAGVNTVGAERDTDPSDGAVTGDTSGSAVAASGDCAIARNAEAGGAGVSAAGIVVSDIPAGGSPESTDVSRTCCSDGGIEFLKTLLVAK